MEVALPPSPEPVALRACVIARLRGPGGLSPEHSSAVCCLTEPSEVRAMSDCGVRLVERRRMMQVWVDYLDGLKGAK